jgi:hypothetical protein
MAQKNKPAHDFRIGRIKVAIWPNKSPKNDTWYNVTVVRSYKDADEWKDTSSFRRDDLPVVSKAMDMAYAWIWEQEVQADPEQVEEE